MSIYGFFVWLEIDLEMFLILTIFMCIDSFLGAIKSVRLGDEFCFRKLLWGFCLKLCFLIIPLIVALLAKGLKIGDFSLGVEIVMRVLLVSEALSCITNIYSAKNKVRIKNVDYISMLLNSIRKAMAGFIRKSLSNIESGANCKIDSDKDEE